MTNRKKVIIKTAMAGPWSKLSNLSSFLLNHNPFSNEPVNLGTKMMWHNYFLTDFKKTYHPSQNQVTFIRAVSLQGILKNPDFPHMGNFSSDEIDNIRFEPLLNGKLLKIIMKSLQKIKPGNTAYKLVSQEIKIIKNELARINKITSLTPEIISKNLYSRKNKTPHRPTVSVITASYNLAPYVEETMRSVANQNCKQFEHIVIDGNSIDGSQNLIKKYPNVTLISEKDSGYPEAFRKGLNLAKGDFIAQCCISDSYASREYLSKCLNIMEKNKDISLIWSLSCGLSAESKMLEYSHQQFNYTEAPQREEMFYYWLKTGCHYPEINIFVRKSVILKCYPQIPWDNRKMLDWLEFSYRFNAAGYLSVHLPMLANFYHRDHDNQMGKKLDKNGWYLKMYSRYLRRNTLYRWKLIFGLTKQTFVDPQGKPLEIKFDRNRLIQLYVIDEVKKYLQPKKYLYFLKRLLNEQN